MKINSIKNGSGGRTAKDCPYDKPSGTSIPGSYASVTHPFRQS